MVSKAEVSKLRRRYLLPIGSDVVEGETDILLQRFGSLQSDLELEWRQESTGVIQRLHPSQ